MDNINRINGVYLTPLRIINHPKGDIFHVMKCSDNGFEGFGEVYCSKIKFQAVKAWKKHLRMTCNFVVITGSIKIIIFDDRIESSTHGTFNEYILSKDNYYRLTVPPGLWYGFTGLKKTTNLLFNVANLTHDPQEQINIPEKNELINYSW